MRDSDGFEVPYGLDPDDRLVPPEEARKGTTYRCPGCAGALLFRKGLIRHPHFAHRPGTSCSAETVLHKTAKRRIVAMVENWKAGRGKLPRFVLKCGCGTLGRQPLPENLKDAQEEWRLPSGHIVDVALLGIYGILMAVEVLVTHRVDEGKRPHIKVPWVEVTAETVCRESELWVTTQHGPVPYKCAECGEMDRKQEEIDRRDRELAKKEAAKMAALGDQLYPARRSSGPYRGVKLTLTWADCPNCGKRTPKFFWPNGCPYGTTSPAQTPSQVKWLQNRAGAWVFMSTCSECGVALEGAPEPA